MLGYGKVRDCAGCKLLTTAALLLVVWASRANPGDKATHDFLSLYTAAKDAALPLPLPPAPTPPSHQGACLPACDSIHVNT
jgi:hypothetical protein